MGQTRQKAVGAMVTPTRETLASAAERTRSQIAKVGNLATAEDRKAVADLGYEMGLLTPEHAAPYVAQFLLDAVSNKKVGAAAAMLPLLKSFYDRPGSPYHESVVVMGLIE